MCCLSGLTKLLSSLLRFIQDNILYRFLLQTNVQGDVFGMFRNNSDWASHLHRSSPLRQSQDTLQQTTHSQRKMRSHLWSLLLSFFHSHRDDSNYYHHYYHYHYNYDDKGNDYSTNNSGNGCIERMYGLR